MGKTFLLFFIIFNDMKTQKLNFFPDSNVFFLLIFTINVWRKIVQNEIGKALFDYILFFWYYLVCVK